MSGDGVGFLCEGVNVMSGWKFYIKYGVYRNWNNWCNNYIVVYLSDCIEVWDGRFFIVFGLRYVFV